MAKGDRIGLGQYEETFRAHDIDVDVLADATKAGLENIGLPLEASKRLMILRKLDRIDPGYRT